MSEQVLQFTPEPFDDTLIQHPCAWRKRRPVIAGQLIGELKEIVHRDDINYPFFMALVRVFASAGDLPPGHFERLKSLHQRVKEKGAVFKPA